MAHLHDDRSTRFASTRRWLAGMWTAIRQAPHLTLLASLLGIAGSALLAWQMGQNALGEPGAAAQVFVASSPQAGREFVQGFIEEWLGWTLILMLPAFALGLIRLRGREITLPVAVACGIVLLWWLMEDVMVTFSGEMARSRLGEDRSMPAYLGKLLVTGLALLSPAAMTWLYQRGRVLDRHVLRTFLTPFALCFCGLLALFIFFDFYDNGKDLIEARFGAGQMLVFYLVQLPKFMVEIIDISLLLAVLYALGRLSRHNEIISMVTAGVSVTRILLPLFVAGGFAAIITLACSYQYAPEADRKKGDLMQMADDMSADRQNSRARTSAQRVAYVNREDRRFWYLENVPIDLNDQNAITGVEIHELNEDGSLRWSLFARRANWTPPLRPGESGEWRFRNVREMFHTSDPQDYQDLLSGAVAKTGWRETPWRLLSESAKLPAQFLTVPQLTSYLRMNHEFPESRLASYRTWWHDRLARPLRCLIVVLFAAPLGIVFSRRGLMGSVASTIILYFAMYFLTTIFLRLGESGKIPAASATWTVNILFAVVGLILLWQRSTGASPLASLRRFRLSRQPTT
jgi:LPS export ABC transporter permease LptG